MKKLALITMYLVALSRLGAFEIWPLDTTVETKFSTERSSRGRKTGKKGANAKVELRTPGAKNGDLYCGATVEVSVNNEREASELKPCVGLAHWATDRIKLDANFTYNFITDFREKRMSHRIRHDTTEIAGKVFTKFFLAPTLNVCYNFHTEDFYIEGKISHIFNLTNNLAFEPLAKIGYRKANKWGNRRRPANSLGKKDYFYGGFTADLVYKLSEHAKLRIGPEFACNNAKKDSWVNRRGGGHNSLIWFNASANLSF